MDLLDAEQAAANATGPAYGASSGEYTAEKLAELRKSQPFQLPSKPKKKSSGGRVQFDPALLENGEEPEVRLTVGVRLVHVPTRMSLSSAPKTFPSFIEMLMITGLFHLTDDGSNEDESAPLEPGRPQDGGGTQILDDAEVRRLKERKERNRRIGMEDFIPLRTDKDGMARSEEKKGKLAEVSWAQELWPAGSGGLM